MIEAAVGGDGASREPLTAAGACPYSSKLRAGYLSEAEVSSSIRGFPLVADNSWELSVSPGNVSLRAHSRERFPPPPARDATSRRQIREFSRRSELRMLRRLVSIDYAPWLDAIHSGQVIAMVTLTYPGDWESVAPSARIAANQLRAFRSRLERAIGPVSAIRKTEFQRRSAPHMHLMLPLPAVIRAEATPAWISQAWYEVVGSTDQRHLHAGTGVDWSTGARAFDPVRTAKYFARYSSKGSKAYQHIVPELWLENGGSGRFWSTWRLKNAEETISISYDDFVQVRRVMRGLDRSKRRTRKVRVRRVDRRTGRVYNRSVTRRTPSRSLNQSRLVGGGLFTADGPALTKDLGRFIQVLANNKPQLTKETDQ